MRFTLSSTALSQCLNMLSRVINSKNAMPILDCFLLQVRGNELTITASDSDNIMQSVLPLDEVDGEGEFAVPNRTLLDAMKELPEQPLNYDVDTESFNVKVSYQNGYYSFTAQSGEAYPKASDLGDNTNQIILPGNVVAGALGRCLFATANDPLRPVMNGVYFDFTTGGLVFVATDGHKLVRDNYYAIKAEQPQSFILPKKPAQLLKTVLDKDDEDVVIRFDGKRAQVNFSTGKLITLLVDGHFPNYNSVIPADNPNELTIDRQSFVSALRRVLPFASESSQLVRLHLTQGALELSSEDIDFATAAREQLTCDYNARPMDIGFKGSSLLEVLTTLTSEEVTLRLADPSRAGVIVPVTRPDNEDVLMLIMPMLLND